MALRVLCYFLGHKWEQVGAAFSTATYKLTVWHRCSRCQHEAEGSFLNA